MELNKSKFKKEEVEAIINKINLFYNNKMNDCYSALSDLKEENKKLKLQVEKFKKEQDVITSSIKLTTKKTNEVSTLIDKKYRAEVVALTEFHNKWKDYFEYLFNKYPLYPEIKNLKEMRDGIGRILSEGEGNKTKIDRINDTLEKNGKFSPSRAVRDYVALTSDNGFNIDEVLNPGELKLEELCKDLGLME